MKKWSDVLEIRSGRNQKEVLNPQGKYPILGSAGKVMGYADNYICEEGTTIIGRKGTINSPMFIQEKFWNVDTAFGLHAKENLDKHFLFYFCQGFDFTKMDRGSGRPSLVKSDLLTIQIPIPPLPEQKKIVTLLDAAFAKIDQAKANIEKNIENAKELFQSKLNEIFSQKGDGWEEKQMDEVCSITSKLVNPKEEKYQDLLHVGGGNIVSETGELIKLKTTKEEGLTSGKFLFNTNMVLYNKIRPYLVKVSRPSFNGLCSADMYPLTPNEKEITRDFLYYLLISKDFTTYAINGSARAGMPKVNRKHLFNYSFYLPKKDIQNQVIEGLNELRLKSHKLNIEYNRKLENLEELKKSLLQKAFIGELT